MNRYTAPDHRWNGDRTIIDRYQADICRLCDVTPEDLYADAPFGRRTDESSTLMYLLARAIEIPLATDRPQPETALGRAAVRFQQARAELNGLEPEEHWAACVTAEARFVIALGYVARRWFGVPGQLTILTDQTGEPFAIQKTWGIHYGLALRDIPVRGTAGIPRAALWYGRRDTPLHTAQLRAAATPSQHPSVAVARISLPLQPGMVLCDRPTIWALEPGDDFYDLAIIPPPELSSELTPAADRLAMREMRYFDMATVVQVARRAVGLATPLAPGEPRGV